MPGDRPDLDRYPELQKAWDRRQFIKSAAVGTAFMAVGGSLVMCATRSGNRGPPMRNVVVRIRRLIEAAHSHSAAGVEAAQRERRSQRAFERHREQIRHASSLAGPRATPYGAASTT